MPNTTGITALRKYSVALVALILGIITGAFGMGYLTHHYVNEERNASDYLKDTGELRLLLEYLDSNIESLRCDIVVHTKITADSIKNYKSNNKIRQMDLFVTNGVLADYEQRFPQREFDECVKSSKTTSNQRFKHDAQ